VNLSSLLHIVPNVFMAWDLVKHGDNFISHNTDDLYVHLSPGNRNYIATVHRTSLQNNFGKE
jgi:hypothetical protein